tara:strand:+ start:287 stop:742 length:456 start_codon:yes stop_codon:yes gene_type:complete
LCRQIYVTIFYFPRHFFTRRFCKLFDAEIPEERFSARNTGRKVELDENGYHSVPDFFFISPQNSLFEKKREMRVEREISSESFLFSANYWKLKATPGRIVTTFFSKTSFKTDKRSFHLQTFKFCEEEISRFSGCPSFFVLESVIWKKVENH